MDFKFLIITLIFLFSRQAYGEESNRALCVFPEEEMDEAQGIPNEEQLRAICPKALEFFDCFEKTLKQPEDVSKFQNVKKVVIDLCDEDHQLHNAYVSASTCFKTMPSKWPACNDEARDTYIEYRKFLTKRDANAPITANEPHCLINSHAVACLSLEILESCGAEDYSTFVELLQKSKYLNMYCPPDTAIDLRTKFLEFLEQDSTERQHFRRAFIFRKK